MAGDYFRTVYDLMVLAFQTDVTRVATFSLGGEGDAFAIPEIGITESRHQLSHHGGDAGYMEKLTNYDTFAIEQFGYFLTRLAETKDLNGKPLIGSTMALFGSGMSYGHSHGNANLPLVLAGGSDLGLKHGSHLDFNKGQRISRLRPRPRRSPHHRALPALQPPREHRRPHEQPAPPHGPAHGRGNRPVWRQQQGDRTVKRLFFVLGSWFLWFLVCAWLSQAHRGEPFRPEAGKFPPLEKAHSYRGELVFVDHANRRGSLRVEGKGMFRFNDPHPFAMLPYGIVRYHGAPADLRDIPLGTVLHVRAFLPPDPKTSAVPVLAGQQQGERREPQSGSAPHPPRTTSCSSKTSPATACARDWSGSSRKWRSRNHEGTILASREPSKAETARPTRRR
jgi:hypothetical protein